MGAKPVSDTINNATAPKLFGDLSGVGLDQSYPAASKKPGDVPVNSNGELPVQVQTTIAQGEAAFKAQKSRRSSKRRSSGKGSGAPPTFTTSVVDKELQDHREWALNKKAQGSRGKRGQPPMLERLRAATIIVDRLRAKGVPFATGRNSRMNKLVRERLNEMAARSRDARKSRRKQVSADAVQDMLRQIKQLDP